MLDIGFTVPFNAKNFFDRAHILRALDRATLKVHKEIGRRIRKRAQKSLGYAEGASAPGQPPHAHRTTIRQVKVARYGTTTKASTKKQAVSPLREFVFFVADPIRRSVIVGPAQLNEKIGRALEPLEYGGPAIISSGRGRRRKLERVTIRARPFMRPAAAQELPGLPALWRNAVR